MVGFPTMLVKCQNTVVVPTRCSSMHLAVERTLSDHESFRLRLLKIMDTDCFFV